MIRDVRVVLVGDEGVGKSSIVAALIKESFVQLQPRTTLPEVTIPPEVTPGHDVTTLIIDTSPRPQDRAHLENEIRKASVVAIVYAIDNPTSFDRLPTFWLPTIRSLGVNVPVVLVGNKIDLRGGVVTNEALEDEILPIMTEFKEVETCVECSARIPLNISEIFYFAQNAVLYPTAPLYDTREHVLKPACMAALSRIFKICDYNRDGLLDDAELNDFQLQCFSSPLQTHELSGIKEIVLTAAAEAAIPGSGEDEGDESVIREGGLTEAGFLLLHVVFIQKGRLQTTWTALRKFGYGEDLTLREDFLYPRLDVPHDCSVELSPKGYQFFTDIFETFDKDRDGALSSEELDTLFSTSPGNPWVSQGFPEGTVTAESGAVTLQGWLAQWSMTTLLEPRLTLAYLAYLGYPHSAPSSQSALLPSTTALSITRPRKQERKKGKVNRNVFLAYVLGAAGSGKTSILRNFVGKPWVGRYAPTSKVKTVVNSVETGGAEKYLVLQEFGSTYESEVLRNSKKLALADALVFVYDSSDTNSFSYISNLRQQYKLDDHPSIFVATKSDLDLAQQRHEVQPDTYCRKLLLSVPVAVSIKGRQPADLYHKVISVGTYPSSSIPGGPDRQSNKIGYYVYGTAAVAGVIAVTFVLWRNMGRPGLPK